MAERDELYSWESLSDVMSNSDDLLEATNKLGGPDHNGTKPCVLHVSHLPSNITGKDLVEVLQLKRESVKDIKICSLTGQADISLETGADDHFHETSAPTVIQAHAEESDDIFQKDIFSSYLAQRAASCVEPHLKAFVSDGQMKKLSSYGHLDGENISYSLQEKKCVPGNSMHRLDSNISKDKFQDHCHSFQESLSFIQLQKSDVTESWPDLENDKDSSDLKPGLPVSQSFTFGSLPVSSNRHEIEMAETGNLPYDHSLPLESECQSKISKSKCFSQIQDSERFKMGHSMPGGHSAFVKSNMSSNKMLQNPVHKHIQEVPVPLNLRTGTKYSSKNQPGSHLSHLSESSGSYRHKGTPELYSGSYTECLYSTMNACEDPSSNFGHMEHESSDWQHASPVLESSEQTSTVAIRNVQDEDYAEMCVYYFGNPLKGGGKIKEHNWNAQKSTLYITFEDPFVARQVASSSHTVGKKTVEVSLYHFPLKISPDRCTVEVKGIDPSLKEIYELYFQNPRKSGGEEIVNFQMKENSETLLITYKTSEVADRVVGRKHTLRGSTLHVSHYCPVHDEGGTNTNDTSTVEVHGINPLCQDLYQLYFENPLKGGGTIKRLWLKEDNSVIYITFNSVEVAESVCSKKHVVGGRTLDVTRKLKIQSHVHDSTVKSTEMCTKKFTINAEPKVEEMEEAETPLCTIEVKVRQQDLQNQNNYLHYFENKRNGGGDVEEIWTDEERGVIYITFTDSEVAEKVACLTHIINGRSVEVKLYIPPKPCPTHANKLLLENVDEGASKESLVYFVENVTGFEPQEMLYSDKPGVVLVTFDVEIDFVSVQEKCRKKTFENKFISVSKVSVSNCLLVKSLSPGTTEDVVTLYFESKRNSGGPVDQVEMVPKEDMCLVYFKDYKDAENVLTKSHMINGNELIVKPYLECLGLSGGRPDPKFFVMPKPLVFKEIDPYIVAFIRQTASFCNDFFRHLHSVNAMPEFINDALVVECTLTVSVVNARMLASTWSKEVEELTYQQLNHLKVYRTTIIQEIWPMVEPAIREYSKSKNDSALLFTVPEKYSLTVVGLRDKAKKLYDDVCGIVQHVEEEVQRKKTEITETNKNFKSHQLILLEEKSFPSKVQKKYEGLSVKIRTDQPEITFHGVMKDVKEAQIEMLTLLNDVISDKATGVSENQKLLLARKETKDYIQQKFRSKNIVAVWEYNDDITVYAFDEAHLKGAIIILIQSVAEHVQTLSYESAELTLSKAFKELITKILNKHPGILQVTPRYKQQQILIVGIDSIFQMVVKTLVDYLQENTIYTEKLCFSYSRQRFIWLNWKEKAESFVNNDKDMNVTVSMINDGQQFRVSGTSKGLEWAKTHLEKLEENIVCHVELLTDPDQVKFLATKNFAKDFKKLEERNKCVISQSEETGGLLAVNSSKCETSSIVENSISEEEIHSITNILLPCGVTVSVVQTDIAMLSVDVIVNAANERMDHCGGLAKHIVDKGGSSIQTESFEALKSRKLTEGDVLMTRPGKLACRAIIHAVGPMYRGGGRKEDDCLHDVVVKCLEKATNKGFISIAFPAISAGIFGFPVERSTGVIVEAVKDYLDNLDERTSIRKIYFCHLSADTVRYFTNAIQRTFQGPIKNRKTSMKYPLDETKLPPFKENVHSLPQVPQPFLQQPQTSSQIRVAIIKGKIAEQKVDVIVNSTSQNLQLQNGAISSSILAVAGQALQDECTAKYPNGVSLGGMVHTSSHGLSCKAVFHVALPKWNTAQQNILAGTILECLKAAEENGYTSIAFPPLGTGTLGFPHDCVANIMKTTINKFELTRPSALHIIMIVIYNDPATFQSFENAFGLTAVDEVAIRGKRYFRQFHHADTKHCNSDLSTEFDIAGLHLVIKQGDILDQDVDAIVNSTNGDLDLSKGVVSNALAKKCGDRLQEECKGKVEEMKRRGIVATKAYALKSKKILHLDSERFQSDWDEAFKVLFLKAESESVCTLAIPALGTGAYKLSVETSAEHLMKQLVKFCSDRLKYLSAVHVVLFDANLYHSFVRAIQDFGDSQNSTSIFSKLTALFKSTPKVEQMVKGYSNIKPTEAKLYIYGPTKLSISKVLEEFGEIVSDRIKHLEIPDDVLKDMPKSELEKILQIGRKHNVDIEISSQKGSIHLSGLNDRVLETSAQISSALREAYVKQKSEEAAVLLSKTVQWCFLEVTLTGTDRKDYGEKENHIIELAFQTKKRTAEIKDVKGNIYVIDFDSMTEFPKSNIKDTVKVIRTSKDAATGIGELPSNWASHGKTENVKLVQLQPSDQEFQQVQQHFNSSINVYNRKVAHRILQIERVQNQTLYCQYQAKKAQMESQNTGQVNEKILWHGTSSDAPQNINNYGFNRSYCGKNATQFGQGVYFAVHSGYSAQVTYSPPDPATGSRYMYQSRVLIGHTTQGSPHLRVLPKRTKIYCFDSATDNPNNPGIYVIFNDTQAYPEYLITFQ